MSKFNPDIPEQAPAPESYLNQTRPLSAWDIGINKTGQTALTGIGSIFGEAIKGVDEIIKDKIDRGVRQDLNTERDATTGAIEQMAGLPQDQRVSPIQPDQQPALGPQGPSTDLNIIPGATAVPVPAALQGVDQSVAGASTGVKAKPELSTYYLGKLDMISKDWRSRYPGYSDYIDQRVASIVGGNPANERLRQMMTIIQQQQGNGAQEKEKALGFVGSNAEYPGAAGESTLISSGIPNPMAHAIGWVSKWKAIDKSVQDNIRQNTLDEGNNKIDVFRNNQTAVDLATGISKQMWSQTIDHLSIGPDGQISPDKLNKYLTDIQTGVVTPTEKDAELYGRSILQFAMNVRRQIDDKLNQSGTAKILGPDKVKAIEDQATSRYTDLGNMFLNKDHGPAGAAARAITMDNDQTGKWLLEDSPIKDGVSIYAAGAKMMGPAISGVLQWNTLGSKYGSVDEVVDEYRKRASIAMGMKPGYTLADVIQHADDSGLGKGNRPAAEREVYNYFTTNVPAQIANPNLKLEYRQQLMNNIFEGRVASKFDDDSLDDKGRLIPGKHTVLSNMTTPQISDAIWNLSGQNPNSDMWLKYKNWVVSEAKALGTTDVKNFGEDAAVNPNVNIQWDNKNNRFQIGYKDSFNSFINQPLIGQYNQQISKMNALIAPLVAIAKKEGVDPTSFVQQQLVNMGYDKDITKDKESELTPGQKYASVKGGYISEPTLQDYSQSKVTPAGLEQIKGTANAAHVSQEWGNPVSPDFKTQHLTEIESPTGDKIQVNKVAASAFQGFLKDLKATGYKLDSVQGYNLRESKSGKGISQHAFGNAIDINPDRNPYVGNPLGVGKMKTDLPKNISDLAAKWGLTWGGDWHSVKDPMHFEYTGRKPKMEGEEGFKVSGK